MLHDYQLSILEPKAIAARGCITPIPKTPQLSPCAANRTKDEPKAMPVVQSKGEPRETPHHGDTPRGVDTMDILHRLAVVDTNIDALLGWYPTFRTGNWSLAASRTWARKTGPDWNAGLTIRDRTANRAGNVWPAHYGYKYDNISYFNRDILLVYGYIS